MRIEDMKTHQNVLAESEGDPAYQAEWARTNFAHTVAMQVIEYRIQNKLTQTELGRRLGMRQPHIARLEAGDHEPSLVTLQRLSRVLGVEFHIAITPESATLSA